MAKEMLTAIKGYTEYMCGVLDTLAEFKEVLSAADVKRVIKAILEDVAREAYILGQESKE